MKNSDGLLYSRICEGKRYSYSVCENGDVVKTSRVHFVENKVTPYLRRGRAMVKINQKEYLLKNLVARHFLETYHDGDCVETVNGNPLDCRRTNLRVCTKSEHGRRTGYRSRSQKVIANGVEYRSIRECAKALFVSDQTVLDYMSGKVKKSVLQGVDIKYAESLKGQSDE